MIGEMNIGGVFVPRLLLAAILAFGLAVIVKRVFRYADFYRFVWHAGLFDTALFVILWWLTAAATIDVTPYGAGP
ncbi:MAG: DUF1656 domain-containing protein [Rhizomicrobium sp.]